MQIRPTGLYSATNTKAVRRHLSGKHLTVLVAIRMGYRLHSSAFQSPMIPRAVKAPWMREEPALMQHYIKPATKKQFRASSKAHKILLRKYLPSSLYVDRSKIDQCRYDDSVIGKLLRNKALVPRKSHAETSYAEAAKCRCDAICCVLDWPQPKSLYKTGPIKPIGASRDTEPPNDAMVPVRCIRMACFALKTFSRRRACAHEEKAMC